MLQLLEKIAQKKNVSTFKRSGGLKSGFSLAL
jgi:hypothetical protein